MARGRGRGRLGAQHGGGRKPPGRGKAAMSVATRAAAEAGTQYNPGIRETRQEVAGSRKRQADLGSWYAQLAADYQGAQKAGSAALESVENATAAQQAEASQRSGTEQAALGSSDEALAKLVGGPRDTAGLAKIAAAGAAAERGRVEQAQPIAAQQANFVAQLGLDKAASRLGGIEARQEEGRRREKLKSNLAAQRGERNSARIAAEGKLIEANRGYATEVAKLQIDRRQARTAEQAAAASAALAQLKANHEATQDAIANRQAQERIGVERTNAKISRRNAHTSAVSAHTSARSQRATERHYEREDRNRGKLSTAEKRSRREHSSDALDAAKSVIAIEGPPKNAKDWAALEGVLREQLGGSYSAEISKAVEGLKTTQAAARRRQYARRALKQLPSLPAE